MLDLLCGSCPDFRTRYFEITRLSRSAHSESEALHRPETAMPADRDRSALSAHGKVWCHCSSVVPENGFRKCQEGNEVDVKGNAKNRIGPNRD
ncbi:hypothetical protein PHSY_003139 [Pseudozyma hubeiensis SY62]|uniref:Uncharacterized protein n=1 Tax=Pseudozyma hubeiensis (strain SY62) TaxID=1305764 RepID=R9P2E2_PSEHS|nr:hypothetical protein PHSY_003139 [Pseudozyma hubeiensis SY62]GAC95563.1 hypothetical protein PHSY_003139 [Pseudozyma hubeiensis SY62]